MVRRGSEGFTIIETMLFFAVSGLLTAAILLSASTAINQQRYKESVDSLKSYLQEQYGDVINMLNDRTGNESCQAGVVVVPPNIVPDAKPRGTSDCIQMGRVVTIDAEGKTITSEVVVGSRTTDAPEENTDIDELRTNYHLASSPVGVEKKAIEWGSTVVRPHVHTAQSFTMMVVRSPITGIVMTFATPSVQTNLDELAVSSYNYSAINLCLSPSSDFFMGKMAAVRINPLAATESAIEVPAEQEAVCD